MFKNDRDKIIEFRFKEWKSDVLLNICFQRFTPIKNIISQIFQKRLILIPKAQL